MPATYTLPPALYAKAVALGRLLVDLHFARELWPIAVLLLLLQLKIPARLSACIARYTPRPWLRTLLFAAPFLLLFEILQLPIDIAAHSILVRFGLSVQHWPSWFADAAKSTLIESVIGTLLIAILFCLLRRAPQRWWLWLWAILIPIIVAGVVLTPLLIDPLFNKFEPLAQTDPALVTQLERVVQRGGITIPPDRIFLMRASAKTTQTNAYVTGFGASKRIVVWDNTIKNMPPDEIAFIFGHEMGHYVLRHVAKSLLFTAVLLFFSFWLGAKAVNALLRRFGPGWRIASLQDPATLAVMLLVLATAQILTEPIASAWSRHIEHAADIYGQEAVHGIVRDPQATATSSFQHLGAQNLSTPERRPVVEFWIFNHPAIADRITFAAAYDPWGAGAHPTYFGK